MYSTRTSWIVIILFILSGFAVSTCAHADWYGLASYGVSRGIVDDRAGTPAWRQDGYPHHEDIKTSFYSVGLGYNFNRSFAVEARYYDAGTITSQAQWNYDDAGTQDPFCPCSGHGTMKTTGGIVSGIARYHVTPDFTVGLEVGVNDWHAPYTEYTYSQFGPGVHGPVKSHGLSPMGGIVIGYGSFDLRYELLTGTSRDSFTMGQYVLEGVWKVGF